MKKTLKVLILSLLVIVSMFSLFACNDNDDVDKGLVLTKSKADSGYRVSKFVDDGVSIKDGVLDIGALATEQGKTVESIKTNVFKGNDTIKKIIVPDTVTKIEAGAFAGMKALEEIVLPFVGANATGDSQQNNTESKEEKAVDDMRSVGYVFGTIAYDEGKTETLTYAESKTTTYYFPQNLNRIVIAPSEEYEIPMYAFSGVVGVGTVVLGKEVTAVGENAFSNSTISNIEFEENSKLNKIKTKAFYGASKLKKIVLPQNVVEIGESAFASAISDGSVTAVNELEEIVLSEKLEVIKEGAFAYCEKLKIVNTNEVVATSIQVGNLAFANCKALDSDTLKTKCEYDDKGNCFYENNN